MRLHAPSGSATPAVSDRTGGLPCLTCMEPFTSRLVRLSRESRDSRAPSLKSRDEGTHAPRGQRPPLRQRPAGTCVSPLRVSDDVRQRRDGGQASYSSSQSCYRNPFGQHGQGGRCRKVPSTAPDLRTSSRVPRSRLACNPEAEVCKIGAHERHNVENTTLRLQRTHVHAVDESREDGEDRRQKTPRIKSSRVFPVVKTVKCGFLNHCVHFELKPNGKRGKRVRDRVKDRRIR